MKMIKQQTKALIQQELNDYANDMTNQHNKYIEKLNTKLLQVIIQGGICNEFRTKLN